MKKILFITAFLPSNSAAAEKNTKIMLEDLSSDNIVDLVYFRYSSDEYYKSPNKNVKVLEFFKISLISKLFNVATHPFLYPIFSVRFNWLNLFKLKRHVRTGKYDIIICDHSQTFLYAKYLNPTIPKILLSHDVIAQRIQRTSSIAIQKFCIHSERYCLSQPNSYVFSFSQKDCDLIKNIYGIKAFLCLDYIDPKIISAHPNFIGDYFVFIGKWSRADNLDGVIWFIEKVCPLLKKNIDIKIIGKNFPYKLLSPLNSVSIECLGFVDDPYPIIANSKALLAPLFTGAGIKVKVIEALACGTPVIGTDIAFEGIPNDFSNGMVLANDAKTFANKLVSFNMGLDERIKMKKRFIKNYKSITIPEFLKNKV